MYNIKLILLIFKPRNIPPNTPDAAVVGCSSIVTIIFRAFAVRVVYFKRPHNIIIILPNSRWKTIT